MHIYIMPREHHIEFTISISNSTIISAFYSRSHPKWIGHISIQDDCFSMNPYEVQEYVKKHMVFP